MRWKFRGLDIMKFLMMNENLWWKTFKDPSMSESLIWSHSSLGIPIKTSLKQKLELFNKMLTSTKLTKLLSSHSRISSITFVPGFLILPLEF